VSVSSADREAMVRALSATHATWPHPNPRVGAVVLDAQGREVAIAAHHAAGESHAEVMALDDAGDRARGGTVVVTLEPCDHHGRTPPCASRLIEAGVTRVVVGAVDPDPRVSGRGIARLRDAGIEVTVGIEAAAVEANDPGYFHHRRTGLPLVTLKAALTLDGQGAAADGSSQWITGEEARADGHRLRAEHDAVMVGAGTLRDDDPRLDVRLPGFSGRQPVPVVVAGQRPLPASARIWSREPVILAGGPVSALPAPVIQAGSGGRVDLRSGLLALAELGHLSVLVEGGAGVAGSLWEGGLVHRGVWYLGARVAGGVGRGAFDRPFETLGDAKPVTITDVRRLGEDIRVDWIVGPAESS
jgi:diaminohydroxyphosphoribosylaminopyrimidine deaminase/5-amino-6-(5-phosphoribosylamino)uracil reductase